MNALELWRLWAYVCGVLALVLLGLAAFLTLKGFAEALREDRRAKKVRETLREKFSNRPRGTILKVGHPQLGFPLAGFEIDCLGRIPATEVVFDGERTVRLFGGYTEEELAEIAARAKEFVL